MKKQLIHVRRFLDGNQGGIESLGTVVREVRRRKLYVPVKLGCESARMVWREHDLVTICANDYVVEVQADDFGDRKAGDLIVSLSGDARIPSDLCKVKA